MNGTPEIVDPRPLPRNGNSPPLINLRVILSLKIEPRQLASGRCQKKSSPRISLLAELECRL